MRVHHERLRAKGWSEEEIAHAQRVAKKAQEQKHPAHSFLEVAVFWGLLFLTVIGIFLVSLVIVPLLLALPTSGVLFVLGLLGLVLGTLFSWLIQDIEWVERKHHALNILILAGLGLLSVWFITGKVRGLAALYGHDHNPWLLAATFAASLLTPYLIHIIHQEVASRGKGRG